MRLALASILAAALAVWVLGIGPLCWILRDGLGPGSIDSSGLHAIGRWLMTFYWGPVLLALVVALVAVFGTAAKRTR